MDKVIQICNLLCLLFIIGLSIWLFWVFINCLIKSKKSIHWPKIDGIVKNSIYEYVMVGDSNSLQFKIEYEYFILNKKYISNRIFFKTLDFDEDNYLKKYPKGRMVTVYYNPKKYQEAILEPGIKKGIYIILGLALFFTAISFTCSYVWYDDIVLLIRSLLLS